MPLPVKKIYVSSRNAAPGSVSSSNFNIQLATSVELPQDTSFYLDDICIPHSWYAIEKGINDQLYMSWQADQFTLTANVTFAIITIPSQQYDGPGLLAALTTAFAAANLPSATVFTWTYNQTTNQLKLVCTTGLFYIYTDNDLTKGGALRFGTNAKWDPFNFHSINDCFQNYGTAQVINGVVTPAFYTGFLDLLTFHNIYITSANLGTFTTIGPRGEGNIIRKVPVTAPFGVMIIDRVTGVQRDYLDCSRQSLKNIEFQFRDSRGNDIPLHGAAVSFTIVFVKSPED